MSSFTQSSKTLHLKYVLLKLEGGPSINIVFICGWHYTKGRIERDKDK